MDGFGVVVLVIFGIIASVVKAAQKAQGTGAPGRRLPPRPQGGVLGSPPADLPRQAGAPTPQQRAEALVPDDLWALLTGQQRQPGRSSFELPPVRTLPTPAEPDEPEAAALVPVAAAPLAVAAVAVAPMASPAPPETAAVTSTATSSAAGVLGSLRQGADLRRAMMLQVVLGPPRALE